MDRSAVVSLWDRPDCLLGRLRAAQPTSAVEGARSSGSQEMAITWGRRGGRAAGVHTLGPAADRAPALRAAVDEILGVQAEYLDKT
jgi:hypothetical protein